MVEFGFSLGDFVAVGDLVFRVTKALKERGGSSDDFTRLTTSLDSLLRCLRVTSAIILELSFDRRSGSAEPEPSVLNGIKHALEECQKLLRSFLKASENYTLTLLPQSKRYSLSREWSKIKWLTCERDVKRLERDLNLHVQAFQVYSMAICLQSTKSAFANLLTQGERIETKIVEMFGTMKTIISELPREIGYTWEGGWTADSKPIRFSDCLGRNTIIPLLLCTTKQVFHEVLKIMFRQLPGQKRIENEEYELHDESGLILQHDGDFISRSGAIIYMSVVLHMPSFLQNQNACPRCGVIRAHPALGQKLVQCCYCQIHYRIKEQDRIQEHPERAPEAEPLVHQLKADAQVKKESKSKFSARPQRPKPPVREESLYKRISYLREKVGLKAEVAPPISASAVEELEDIALHLAAAAGDVELIAKLLDAGSDPNACDDYYGSVLQAAASAQSESAAGAVRLLVARGAEVNTIAGNFATALQAASASMNAPVMELLLGAGADPNIQGGECNTALQAACRRAFTEGVRLLLAAGADVSLQGGHCGNALQTAAATAYPEAFDIVQLLLEHGADPNTEGGFYHTALQGAAAFTDHFDSLSSLTLLLDHGANINTAGGTYGSALHAAVYKAKPALVRLLLERGADVNMHVGSWGSPLYTAVTTAYESAVEVAEILLDHGAEINAVHDCKYRTVLAAADALEKRDMVSLLLDRGALL